MKRFFQEFKEFVMRGNVLNLAVGVIIGVAFQGIVASLTDNILSPIIGLFAQKNLDALQFDLLGTTIRYGAFLTSVINFIIMAFVIFLLVKLINRLFSFGKKKELQEEAKPEYKCRFCLTQVDHKAIRCPHCTSKLEEGDIITE